MHVEALTRSGLAHMVTGDLLTVQLRNLAEHDVNNIPVPKRPPDADAQNLPEAWINVYKPFYTSAPFVATSNTT